MSAAAGVIAGNIFRKNKLFGETFVSMGYDNPSNTITAKQIEKLIKEKKLLPPISFHFWRNLPFVIGDDEHGYWFSKEKLNKYAENFQKSVKVALVASIVLILLGALIFLVDPS